MTFTHAARRCSTSPSAMRPASSADPHVTSTTTLSFFATLRSFLLVVSPALTDWRSPPRPSGCPARRTLQYRAMATASTKFAAKPRIEFGTSGWRARIADEFTFANVRLAVAAIAQHVLSRTAKPTVIVGFDRRFYSEEFSRLSNPTITVGFSDRKSTRLNSSHVRSSYAGFCLHNTLR